MKAISYISCGIFTANQAMLLVMYPILADRMKIAPSALVACFTLGSLLFLWGSPFWAARSDATQGFAVLRIGIYGSITALLGLILLLLFGAKLNSSLCILLLALSRVVYGLFASAIIPVAQGMLGKIRETRERVKSLATLSMFLNLGRFLGPIVAIPWITKASLELLLLPLLLFVFLLPATGKEKISLNPSSVVDFRWQDFWPHERERQWLFLLALITTSVIGILQSSLGIYLQSTFALSSESASQLMAKLLMAGGLCTVLLQFALRTFMRHPWQGSMPLGCLLLSLGSFSLIWIQDLNLIYVPVVSLSLGIALLTPSYTSAMSLHAREQQGRSAGNLSAAHILGYGLGGFLSFLGLPFSESVPFEIATILAIASSFLMWPIYKDRIVDSTQKIEGSAS